MIGKKMTRKNIIRKILAGASLILLGLSFSASAAAASKPNLVLITIDSARADRMGFLGAKAAHTPNLDRLAASSNMLTPRRPGASSRTPPSSPEPTLRAPA